MYNTYDVHFYSGKVENYEAKYIESIIWEIVHVSYKVSLVSVPVPLPIDDMQYCAVLCCAVLCCNVILSCGAQMSSWERYSETKHNYNLY